MLHCNGSQFDHYFDRTEWLTFFYTVSILKAFGLVLEKKFVTGLFQICYCIMVPKFGPKLMQRMDFCVLKLFPVLLASLFF